MLSKLPVSLAWFAFTLLIYVLQMIPFTGIFLMFLLAPFWSIITVNAGFVFLALEALARPGYRVWLLAPAIYIGGYAIAASLSHQELAQLDAQFRADNAQKSVAFDPATNDLVVERKSRGLDGVPGSFVRDYNLDVAYEAKSSFDTASHRASRIAKHSVCKQIRANKDARAARIYAARLKIDGRRSNSVCIISGPEDPSRPVVSVSSKRTKPTEWLLPATIDTITIREPSGRAIELKSGYASPLPWIPMPVMGCALNSGAPSWDCSVGFLRLAKKGLGAPGTYGMANKPIIAKALGLRPITTAELIAKATDRLPATLEATIENRIDISLANLKRIIANPAEKLTVHDIKGMRDRPDLWRDDVPAMSQTLQRAFDGGYATRERAGMLQDLLNLLPANEYRPVAQEILSGLQARPDLKRDFVRRKTLARLGELGPSALPVLEARLTSGKRGINRGAIMGICKVGAPAAHLAEKIAGPLLETEKRRSRDQRFAAFVTLLKLGRPDLADRILAETRLAGDKVVPKLRNEISAQSPPTVCVDRNAWRNRLRNARRS